MLAVKEAHCGGDQDFVVGPNEDQRMTMGFRSIPLQKVSGQTLTQWAVHDYISHEDSRTPWSKRC